MTCLGCKYARLCIMYEPRMKACKDYRRNDGQMIIANIFVFVYLVLIIWAIFRIVKIIINALQK